MSRGLLRKAIRSAIDKQLPIIGDLRTAALSLAPDSLSMRLHPESDIPLACVAFHDCTNTLAEVRHALFEYFAHGKYYRERRTNPDESVAIFFERFYLDDAALRLYAAGEQLATAVRQMYEIAPDKLRHFRTGRASEQSTIAGYLRRHGSSLALTETLLRLGNSAPWQFTISYRNRWVHEQPPTVAGRGIQYRRGRRWQFSADKTKRYLGVGMGDAAELDVPTLANHVLAANQCFVDVVRDALEEYFKILKEHGVERTEKGISFRLFG